MATETIDDLKRRLAAMEQQAPPAAQQQQQQEPVKNEAAPETANDEEMFSQAKPHQWMEAINLLKDQIDKLTSERDAYASVSERAQLLEQQQKERRLNEYKSLMQTCRVDVTDNDLEKIAAIDGQTFETMVQCHATAVNNLLGDLNEVRSAHSKVVSDTADTSKFVERLVGSRASASVPPMNKRFASDALGESARPVPVPQQQQQQHQPSSTDLSNARAAVQAQIERQNMERQMRAQQLEQQQMQMQTGTSEAELIQSLMKSRRPSSTPFPDFVSPIKKAE